MSGLPPVPSVDPGLLLLYEREHTRLDELRAQVAPAVDVLFRRFALSVTARGLTGIAPSWQAGMSTEFFPTPRAFLTATDLAKISGAEAALQYVDSRLAMVAQGHDRYSFRPEAPFVLHALTEGRMDNPSVTNPGMLRATPVWEGTHRFAYPVGEEVRGLYEQALETAMHSTAPACVVAAWLLNTTIYVHPFCDANGRVGWLLYLLLAGRDVPGGFDWGVAEHWPIRKDALVAARGAARSIDEVDEGPVVSLVLRISAEAAGLMRQRLAFFADAFEAVARLGGSPAEVAALVLAIAIRRLAPADALAEDLGVPYNRLIDLIRVAADGSLVRRVKLPPSRRAEGPARPGFALGVRATEAISSVLARHAA